MEFNVSTDIGGKTLTISSGKLAKQASGSVLIKYEGTIVLVTVVSEYEEKNTNFLPLSVEYQEKIYSAGRIPGNYFRREIGRPSEKETLTARLIDRPIRPLFPKNYKYETQIISTVLSMDYKNDPDILAMIGASAALTISDIPFMGPIASIRIGRINNKLILNPTIEELNISDMNIIVSGSKNGIVMVEGEGNIITEEEILNSIFLAHKSIQPIIEIQEKLQKKIGKQKRTINNINYKNSLFEEIERISKEKLQNALLIPEKIERSKGIKKAKIEILSKLNEEIIKEENLVNEILDDLQKKICRNLIIKENKRIDKRLFDEIRPISCEISLLPRPHGSALFTRGETQVLSILTLGSGQDEQRIETLSGEEYKSFMLHYNFPPFSVGEVKRIGSPSRRDIGHGNLAKKALEKVIPKKEDFDYTIRIVSEVLESNGSSSMATVCAGSLAMMDGGIPIKEPVSGIAMGLIKEEDKVIILSDILGDEDHAGDMDFKIAGTSQGITALQMDIKIQELSKDIMEKALEQAKIGRLKILEIMNKTIDKPRKTISPYAPKVITINIPTNKIRDIIGPGGKIIRALQTQSNTKIEIDDTGLIKITGNSFKEVELAKSEIEKIAIEPKIGKIYKGKVVKITEFGAFIQIAPGVDGLLHISQLANYRVKKVNDIINKGEEISVKIVEITKNGKIRLSKINKKNI